MNGEAHLAIIRVEDRYPDFRVSGELPKIQAEYERILFSQADIVNDSEGNDVELYKGLSVSVFDDDFDEQNRPDALLAEGVVIKNFLESSPNVKWLVKLIENKGAYRSGNAYVHGMSGRTGDGRRV